MKTRFFSMSALAVAAIAFIGCNKVEQSIETPEKINTPFEFIATGIDTKTTNDGVHTNWASGDEVNLFHAVAGSTSYVAETSQFVASAAGSSVTFTGTLNGELTEDYYDWYAIYPYGKYITTPASTSGGYVTIGSAYNGSQAQTGNDSKAHLAGSKYPVAGKVTNVAKATKPSIAMSHLTSVVAVHVTNGTAAPITVSEVSFTGTEDIVGTYYINFVDSPVGYTPSGPTYVSTTATLNVTSGSAIDPGEGATFYLAVKPFTAHASETISLSVTADNGAQVRNKDLTSDANFVAGTINTLNFTYDKAAPALSEPSAVTGWYRVENPAWLTADDRVVIVNADGTQAMSKVQKTNNRDGVGITVEAEGDYKHIKTFNDNAQVFILETGTVSGSFAFWCENGDEASKYIYAASSSENHLKSRNTINDNASFIATLPEGVGNLTAQGEYTHKVMQFNSTLFSCYVSAGYSNISVYKYYGAWTGSTTCANPTISQEGNTVTITCSTPGVKIYYTTNGDTPTTSSTLYSAPISLTESVTIKAIATRSHYASSEVVTLACTPQVATPVIEGAGTSFTISCATPGASIFYEISTTDLGSVATPTSSSTPYTSAVSISQTTYVKAIAIKDGYTNSTIASETCAYSGGGVSTATFTFSTMGYSNAADVTTVTTDDNSNTDITLTFAQATNGSNAPKYYTTGSGVRMYNGNTLTITGGTITKVVLTASGNSYTTNATANTGTVSKSGAVETWTGSTSSLVLTAAQTSRTQTIVVTYTK